MCSALTSPNFLLAPQYFYTQMCEFYVANVFYTSHLFSRNKGISLRSRLRLKCDGTREQKPDFVFRRNGRVHLNRRGRQFSRLLVAEVFASVVVMLDTSCSEVVWRVLATHSLHFTSLRHRVPSHFNWTLLLHVWDRSGSTGGPLPCQLCSRLTPRYNYISQEPCKFMNIIFFVNFRWYIDSFFFLLKSHALLSALFNSISAKHHAPSLKTVQSAPLPLNLHDGPANTFHLVTTWTAKEFYFPWLTNLKFSEIRL